MKGIEKRIENHFSHREFHDGTCGEKVHAKLYPFKSFKNSKDEQTDGQVYKAVFFYLCVNVFLRGSVASQSENKLPGIPLKATFICVRLTVIAKLNV